MDSESYWSRMRSAQLRRRRLLASLAAGGASLGLLACASGKKSAASGGSSASGSSGAAAQGAPVRVLVSNGMKAALMELQPQCERAIGHPLAVQFHSTVGVKKKIEAGEAFDVAVITTEAIDDLIKEGKLAKGSRADVAHSSLVSCF